MKLLLNATLGELEDKINRQILVDEDIELASLAEFVIVSMNGKKIPIYEIECGKITYYPFDIEETKNRKTLIGLTLKDLKLKKGSTFCLEYNFENSYYFNLVVDDIIEGEANNDIDFKVLSGKGYGLIDDEDCFYLKNYIFASSKINDSYYTKKDKEYLQKSFDVNEVNDRINVQRKNRENRLLSKQYVFNVSLEGFDKEIKRKVLVNSNITVDSFCRKVIVSMNGDLSHPFDIKMGKEYLRDYYGNFELFYLNLKEKNRLKIVYDFGDNWRFNLMLSKIVDGTSEDEFAVLSGNGYGIIDDCGGVWGLSEILSGKDTSWGEYDINEFNLEKCNEKVKKY